jgi:transcription initiation factor TFIID subunit 2
MDLGTMQKKLATGEYHTSEQFKADMELILSNCRQFNPPGTLPCVAADTLEKAFRREWPKVVERKIPFTEKRGLQSIMNALMKEDSCVILAYYRYGEVTVACRSFIFREPVDPQALQIPHYHNVIPKKDCRDLKSMKHKLDTDKYESIDAFEADLKLMIDNALKFNGVESEVGQLTVTFSGFVDKHMSNFKSGLAKKRKDGDSLVPVPPTKKARVG